MFRAPIVLLSLFALLWSATVRANDDDLPPGAIARLGTLAFHDGGKITALAVSPDGKLLATGTKSGTWISETGGGRTRAAGRICLWNASTGERLRILDQSEGYVQSVAFSTDGKMLAACYFIHQGSGRVKLWEVATGKLRNDNFETTKDWHTVAFTLAGSLQLTETNGRISTWDTASGKRLRQWDPWNEDQPMLSSGHPAETCPFAVLAEQSNILVLSVVKYDNPTDKDSFPIRTGKHIRVWDVATGETLAQIGQDELTADRKAISPDGKLFATAFSSVQIFETATGEQVQTLTGFGASVTSMAFSPNHQTLATMHSFGRGLRLWDTKTGKLLFELPLGICDDFEDPPVAFSPDGKTIFVGACGVVHLFDANSGKEQLVVPGHRIPVEHLHFSPDGRTLTTQDQTRTCEWEVGTGKPLAERVHFSPIPGTHGFLALTGDGTRSIRADEKDRLCIVDTASDKALVSLEAKEPRWGVFSPNGQRVLLATGVDMGVDIGIIDPSTGKVLARPLLKNLDKVPVFSPDGTRLGWATDNGELCLSDTTTGKVLRRLREPDEKDRSSPKIEKIVFSPDGHLLAAVIKFPKQDNTDPPLDSVVVYDLATGTETMRLTPTREKQDTHEITCLTISADNRFVATGHDGETMIRLWELASGQERGRFDAGPEAVTCLAFAPDGKRLVSGSEDGTALVWNLDGPLSRNKLPVVNASDAAALWDALDGLDGPRIDEAVWTLARSPAATLPLLREKLPPVKAATPETLKRLLADLDHDDFATRATAARQLEALQEIALPTLQTALKGKPSAEARHSLERLLELRNGISPELLRRLRAVEVLERIGNHEARTLLEALADGAPEARLTREAKAAVARLTRR